MKPEINITPANSVPFLANDSTTADVTAVPKEWPRMTIRLGGILATLSAQLTVAMPSTIRPSSVGKPVEYPKPR